MLVQSELDDVVRFEVAPDYADELWEALHATRLTWLHRDEDGLFVVAALRAEPGDLARLLRDAQAWIAGSHLPYLMFALDDREYVLGPAAEALTARAA
jgi:hypothetical protein